MEEMYNVLMEKIQFLEDRVTCMRKDMEDQDVQIYRLTQSVRQLESASIRKKSENE